RRPGIGARALEARADVADDDARALPRHGERNGTADAPARARDDGDLSGDDSPGHVPSIPLRFSIVHLAPSTKACCGEIEPILPLMPAEAGIQLADTPVSLGPRLRGD